MKQRPDNLIIIDEFCRHTKEALEVAQESIAPRRGPSLEDMAHHAARLERRKGLRQFRKIGTDALVHFRTAISYDRIAACAATGSQLTPGDTKN